MSPVKPVFDPDHLYFITTSTVNRAHLLRREVTKRIIADSLDYMRVQQWISLFVFVIMPNHIHVIARFLEDHQLADVMREFKKHTSKQVIRQYQAENNQKALAYLEKAAAGIKGQRFKVWEDGYDARDIFSIDFLQQKMDYIHQNPCQPHWQLADNPEDYAWSSARFYLLDKPTIIHIDDVRAFLVPQSPGHRPG